MIERKQILRHKGSGRNSELHTLDHPKWINDGL